MSDYPDFDAEPCAGSNLPYVDPCPVCGEHMLDFDRNGRTPFHLPSEATP